MDQYQISNLPSRYQLTQHYQSSLDQPNLQNIQAKLYALRQKNYQMAQNFFQQKYGSSSAYDQYLEQSNMTDLKPVNAYQGSQYQTDLIKHLQYKATQIQMQQLQKINLAKGSQSNQKGNRKSSKINPWVQSNKKYTKNNVRNNKNSNIIGNDSQLEKGDYIGQDDSNNSHQQYIYLKQNNNKKGKFISEFKQYLQNKNKNKHQNQQNYRNQDDQFNNKIKSPSKNMNNSSITKSKLISTVGNNFMQNNSHLSNSGINNTSQKINVNVSPEEQLVKKIFKTVKQISNNHSKGPQQYIQKIELAQYLTQNDKILNVLGIRASQIIQKIHKQLQTKDTNKVKYHQCLIFFYKLLGKQEQHKKLKALHSFTGVPQGCILEPQVIKLFQKIFKSLDKHYDLIVKRLQFIQKLALDPTLNKIINTPAVYEKKLQKSVSLRRIFQRIQLQTILNNDKSNQYVSWEQFIKYFQSGHTDRGKYDILRLAQSLKEQQKMGLNDIPDTIFQIICRTINKLDKGNQYFNTLDLVGQILLDKLYQTQKYSFARGKGNNMKSGNIPMQTFEQVIKRIKQKAPKFISVKQFLQFFSIKGQPIQLIQQRIQKQVKKANDPAKVTKNQDQFFQKNQVDGYDSDPQFYNQSQVIGKKQFRKTFGDKQYAQFNLKDSRKNQGYNVINLQNCKITVPQPFKFEQRQKQRALRKSQKTQLNRSSSLDNRQRYKFKAKQIPKKVKQIGLFQKIIQQNQKRIQERRKCSMLLTLANQQPFNFYNRKTKKKTIEQRKQYQFKANPIPWYCSVNLLQKKEEQQIYRNQKIARMAQQNLNKAKLPPRMQKDYQQKIAQKKLLQNKKQVKTEHYIKAKQPPNFQILHKQFQSALQRKRKQNKTTQVKQFNFSQPKRQKKAKLTQQIQQINERVDNKQQKWRQTLKSSINVLASSTAKFDQQVQKRRKQIEQKKRKQELKQKQLNQKKKVDQQLKDKLKSQTFKGTQKKLLQIAQSKKQEMKKQDQNFKQMKAQWLVNAKKQPLLIQRPLKRDQRLQKMKKLQQISQNLKKNGIKGKQHDAYFNREQLLILQDYQMLKKAQKL